MATLISDQVDFRAKKITRNNRKHYMIKNNPPRYNMYAPNKIYEIKTGRTEKRNTQIHDCSLGLPHLTISN